MISLLLALIAVLAIVNIYQARKLRITYVANIELKSRIIAEQDKIIKTQRESITMLGAIVSNVYGPDFNKVYSDSLGEVNENSICEHS